MQHLRNILLLSSRSRTTRTIIARPSTCTCCSRWSSSRSVSLRMILRFLALGDIDREQRVGACRLASRVHAFETLETITLASKRRLGMSIITCNEATAAMLNCRFSRLDSIPW
eukprot:6180246-Pleurochrysis_carterae.AAC.2